ncbi:MAG: hypothetical protein B6D68_02610 [spirochete symbiont of Stewartia floridana]|nr:MAG: hypothetical protein B6D68_02610 [spirochete symbiont of Stewartia floridana]
MSELLLLRHGEPVLSGAYIGRGSDPPLSRRGRTDAAVMAKTLEQKAPAVIYTSPLRRAWQTVIPLARRLGIHPVIVEGFAELDFGKWEGMDWKAIQEHDPDTWNRWLGNPWLVSPPGGETLQELTHRVMMSLEVLLKKNESHTVLISTHGGPIRVILTQVCSLSPANFWAADVKYLSLFSFRHSGGRIKPKIGSSSLGAIL